MKLDDHVKICPGHDYGSRLISSIRYEKRHNSFLQFENKEEFFVYKPKLEKNKIKSQKISKNNPFEKLSELRFR